MTISYNKSKIFDISNEKTDYKTDNKTDYDTDPGRVKKVENYQHCWKNYWGNTECDTRQRTVTDWNKIDLHKEMNKNNITTLFFICLATSLFTIDMGIITISFAIIYLNSYGKLD